MIPKESDYTFINGRFLIQKMTGVQRYAIETLYALDELLSINPSVASKVGKFCVIAPKGTPNPKLRNIEFKTVGLLSGHAWEQIELGWHARNSLLFSFGFTGPLLHKNQIITIHDAAVVRMPQNYKIRFRLWYTFVVRWIARTAPAIITVSNFSKSEAIDCFGAKEDRILVVTEGWQHLIRLDSDENIIDKLHLRGEKFILAVSSNTPNKNWATIAEAIKILGKNAPKCVVVGSTDSTVFQKNTSKENNITRTGYVTDNELKALYQHATCFVFPSFYEGFGIPPLEAMSLGCPVIASTAPAIVETCHDAALYFNPYSANDLANQLVNFFANADLSSKMKRMGIERARHFSWESCASLNMAAIQKTLN